MADLSGRNFGVITGYILPGLVCLLGAAPHSTTLQEWLATSTSATQPTLAGVVYVMLASLGAGLVCGAFRWFLIDSLHAVTGLPRPVWNDDKLVNRLPAYRALVDLHYNYYKFYANTLVALPAAYAAHRFAANPPAVLSPWTDSICLIVQIVLFAGSRDALGKYYDRVNRLLGQLPPSTPRKETPMTNGGHPEISSVPVVASPKARPSEAAPAPKKPAPVASPRLSSSASAPNVKR